MIIIGLSGKKKTGKNTVATLITNTTKKWVFEVSFGQFLKQEVALACGVTVEHINKNKDQFRPILQWWGTDFRRASDNDYWLYRMDEMLVQLTKEDKAQVVIITDVRFKNEADYIRKLKGSLIRVSRDAGLNDNHISETDLDKYEKWDGIILNTGSMEQLGVEIKDVMNKLKIKL